MKLKQVLFCVILIVMALVFGAMLKGPLPVILAGIGGVAWCGFVLGLWAVMRPMGTKLIVQDPLDLDELVQLISIDATGKMVSGDVVRLRSAQVWKCEQDALHTNTVHTWRPVL